MVGLLTAAAEQETRLSRRVLDVDIKHADISLIGELRAKDMQMRRHAESIASVSVGRWPPERVPQRRAARQRIFTEVQNRVPSSRPWSVRPPRRAP